MKALTFTVAMLAASPALATNVYDARNILIGSLVGQAADGAGLAVSNFVINGTKHFIEVSRNGLVADTVIYFAQSDCRGSTFAAYDPNVDILPLAMWNGTAAFIIVPTLAGDNEVLSMSKEDNTGCTNFSSPQSLPSAPVGLTPLRFIPPFSVR